MPNFIKKVALPEQQQNETLKMPLTDNYLEIIAKVKVECQVCLGTTTLTINELRKLKEGQVLTLHERVDEPITILLDSKIIAYGNLMSSDDFFAIQITEFAS